MTTTSHNDLNPEIVLGAADHRQLNVLAMAGLNHTPDQSDDLLYELERARVVDDGKVPEDIVRMGSTLRFITDAGEDRTVTLVFPAEADIAEGRVSVLTPIGIALIGLAAGQSMDWTARDGRVHRLTVESVGGAPGVPPDAPQTEFRAA